MKRMMETPCPLQADSWWISVSFESMVVIFYPKSKSSFLIIVWIYKVFPRTLIRKFGTVCQSKNFDFIDITSMMHTHKQVNKIIAFLSL